MKYVYILKSAGIYKIGITGNLESRLSGIRTSSPHNVDVIMAKQIKDAELLEYQLHQKYKDKKSGNAQEWFSLTDSEALDVCASISKEEGEKQNSEEITFRKTVEKLLDNQKKIEKNISEINERLRLRIVKQKEKEDTIREDIVVIPKKITTDEELEQEAVEIIKMVGRASSSLLQRKLKIGYARASRIIDMLEIRGYVGCQKGNLPRELIQK